MFVTIPFTKTKVPKECAFIGIITLSIFVWVYIYHKRHIQIEDAAQLVIGAPGPRQISITNPNPVRRAAAKPKPITRLGGGKPLLISEHDL